MKKKRRTLSADTVLRIGFSKIQYVSVNLVMVVTLLLIVAVADTDHRSILAVKNNVYQYACACERRNQVTLAPSEIIIKRN